MPASDRSSRMINFTNTKIWAQLFEGRIINNAYKFTRLIFIHFREELVQRIL